VFSQAGRPDAIIKDCDRTLHKGVRLYSEQQGIKLSEQFPDDSKVTVHLLEWLRRHMEIKNNLITPKPQPYFSAISHVKGD